MKDLLPEKFKIMTKDINTINSKGIKNNKSLQSIIDTHIMLPKDKYLFPTLGVNVKDNFLGLFNWGNDLWGNLDIPLEEHDIDNLEKAEKEAHKKEKNIATKAFMFSGIKSKVKVGKDIEQDQKQQFYEATESKIIRPVRNNRPNPMVNDLYVRKAEKKKIVFKSTDLVLPNL